MLEGQHYSATQQYVVYILIIVPVFSIGIHLISSTIKNTGILPGTIIQYSSNCIYVKDHEGLGFQPKNQPHNSFLTVWQYLVRQSQAKKCLQINPKPFQQVVMKFSI